MVVFPGHERRSSAFVYLPWPAFASGRTSALNQLLATLTGSPVGRSKASLRVAYEHADHPRAPEGVEASGEGSVVGRKFIGRSCPAGAAVSLVNTGNKGPGLRCRSNQASRAPLMCRTGCRLEVRIQWHGIFPYRVSKRHLQRHLRF
jgi:hypothetical protein